MIDPKELRIGNYVSQGIVTGIYESRPGEYLIQVNSMFAFESSEINPRPIAEELM
jgi:hypothetical protein